MERGYLKMWRKSLDCEVFHNPELWRLWSWCLMKTSYKPRFVPFQTGKGKLSVKIEAGQFIFGRSKAAEFLGDSPSTIWKRMKKLELLKNITIQSNKQYSIVTICNWEEYQEDDKAAVTGKEQASDRQVTAEEQLSNTNKKDKNIKKEKTSDYSEKFEIFWKAYPNKQGKFKAFSSWKKYGCDNGIFDLIMTSLEAHKKSPGWLKEGGDYIPHGSTWVNGKGWEDGIEPQSNQEAWDK